MISGKRIDSEPLSEAVRLFAQGARCGHLEGKARSGVYVEGEEIEEGYEAARNQGFALGSSAFSQWAAGYRFGYVEGAQGEELASELVNAPLPRGR